MAQCLDHGFYGQIDLSELASNSAISFCKTLLSLGFIVCKRSNDSIHCAQGWYEDICVTYVAHST